MEQYICTVSPFITALFSVKDWLVNTFYYLKFGSHDPIFASNYSLAHFFRQQLEVWTPIFDKFQAVFVYWMKIEHVLFSSNLIKRTTNP